MLMATEKPTLTAINWFERKAEYIATWTPRPALQGYATGAYAAGHLEDALYQRALEIQDAWRSSL